MSLEKLLTVTDLAEILGRSTGTIKNHIQRIPRACLLFAAFLVQADYCGVVRMLRVGCSCMLFNST